MNKSTIHNLIDKVIGKKGLIHIPSWWMRKVLMQIADWIQEGDDINNEKIEKVKEEANEKVANLNNDIKAALVDLKKSLHTQKCFIVRTGASASYVVVDGVMQDIPANTQKVITFVDTFRFSPESGFKSQLIEFIGLAITDVSTMTTMEKMFSNCTRLTSIDLSGLNTSAVTSMNYMFSSCTNLTSINLSGLDTSKVTTMESMFSSCTSLTSIDLSGLNTSAVTSMNGMFTGSGLNSIDLTGLDTSSVTNMLGMFRHCHNLKSLDLSGLNTSSVTNMSEMFYAAKLESIDFTGLDTSKVTDMGYMFGCYTYDGKYYGNFIKFLDLSSFDTSSVTSMTGMFNNCGYLISLILGPNFFKTSKVTSIDFSKSTKWTNDTVITSLVTNSYDRVTAGLSTLTLQLSPDTKAALTDEQKVTITSKGYTIA